VGSESSGDLIKKDIDDLIKKIIKKDIDDLIKKIIFFQHALDWKLKMIYSKYIFL